MPIDLDQVLDSMRQQHLIGKYLTDMELLEIQAELRTVAEAAERLARALEYYAKEEIYSVNEYGFSIVVDIDRRGSTARAALAAFPAARGRR